jgi:hypothetical protein
MFRNIDRRLRTVPHALTFTGILLAGLLATTALAQERDASRVALVIGNGAYKDAPLRYKDAPLRNAVNDARSMSTRLTALGFEVITAENADRDAMQRSILKFASKLQGETTGLFYYAGHGIQSRGRNHLLPVDAKVASERALRFESVDVQVVLEEMAFAGNRINIVILDACRNNPFEGPRRHRRGEGHARRLRDGAGLRCRRRGWEQWALHLGAPGRARGAEPQSRGSIQTCAGRGHQPDRRSTGALGILFAHR